MKHSTRITHIQSSIPQAVLGCSDAHALSYVSNWYSVCNNVLELIIETSCVQKLLWNKQAILHMNQNNEGG